MCCRPSTSAGPECRANVPRTAKRSEKEMSGEAFSRRPESKAREADAGTGSVCYIAKGQKEQSMLLHAALWLVVGRLRVVVAEILEDGLVTSWILVPVALRI